MGKSSVTENRITEKRDGVSMNYEDVKEKKNSYVATVAPEDTSADTNLDDLEKRNKLAANNWDKDDWENVSITYNNEKSLELQ